MNAPLPDAPTPAPAAGRPWVRYAVLTGISLVVVATLAFIASTIGRTIEWYPDPGEANINLMVRGFQAGHVSLAKAVPEGLQHLADPYDPKANLPYRSYPYWLHDMSYYGGKLYLYYGPVPALVLLWPWVALTGRFLWQSQAAVIFSAAGFFVALGWLLACGRRYFPRVGSVTLGGCALALGLATGIPVLLQRPGVCEVPIVCGYLLVTVALVAIWRVLHGSGRRRAWMAAASLAYGLAVAARPSVLFGAVILLVPVAQAWWQGLHSPGQKYEGLFLAAVGPIAGIGAGLMIYNFERFDSPIEFGQHYQMAGFRLGLAPTFSLHYLWFNIRVYFLEPARLMARFPFVRDIAAPALPAGHTLIESPYGVLTNIPFTLLALAAPLAVRGARARERTAFRWFLAAVALSAGVCALTLCLYWGACERYEVEFVPALVLLAVCGVLGIEERLEGFPVWRRLARAGWLVLLGWSAAFNVLASYENYVSQYFTRAEAFRVYGRYGDAIADYSRVMKVAPELGGVELRLAAALEQAGRTAEAIPHYEHYLRRESRDSWATNGLAIDLAKIGRRPEAIAATQRAILLNPDNVEARYNLGVLFEASGRREEAITAYQQVLTLKPDFADTAARLQRLRGAKP